MGVGTFTNPINLNLLERLFSGMSFSVNAPTTNPSPFGGLLSQGTPALTFNARDNVTTNQHFYFEDTDGVARRAMGAYADTTMTDGSTSSLAQAIGSDPHRIGLPLATANTYGDNALGTPTQQSQSRPIILNRPFRSVSEMSYTFTGTPWKNLDFFTPESGDSALLDAFCVTEPPAAGMVAGKVDLNTRQALVIQALVAGAYRDEWYNAATPPAYALPPLNSTEAANVASKLIQYANDTTDTWRGPLGKVSDLVGRFIANMPSNPSPTVNLGTDWYSYNPPSPVSGQPASVTYAGFTGLLDNTVYNETTNNANLVSPIVQRMRESGLRPLADCGQTRVWNLLIDVIAQTGSYPNTATSLAQFQVGSERHYWQHVAIDRYTGQIIDQSIEEVAEAPSDIVINNLTASPGTAAGTTIGTFNTLPGGTFTYSLIPGGADNSYFTISGSNLQTTSALNVPGKKQVMIFWFRVTNSVGQIYQQAFTVNIGQILHLTDTPTMPFWALVALALEHALEARCGLCLLRFIPWRFDRLTCRFFEV